MSIQDRDTLISFMIQLWPKLENDMNNELANVWGMAIGGATVAQVQAAFRDMKANSTKWPTPAALKAKLSAGREATGERVEMSRWDVYRQQNRLNADEWPDERCRLEYAKWEYERYAATYGPKSLSTATAWKWWQVAAWQGGFRAALPAEGDFDTDPTGRTYAEAIEAKARAA